MITVALVDRHEMFRRGLVTVLTEDDLIQVRWSVSTAAELLQQADVAAQVIVVAANQAGVAGLQKTRQILGRWPTASVLVLAAHLDPAQAFEAMKLGVYGYLSKEARPSDVVAAVQTAADGEHVWDAEVIGPVLAQFESMAKRHTAHLTKREMDVLTLVAKSYSNQQIAEELSLTTGRVWNLVSSILEKLEFSDRTQAAIFALRQGLITE